MKSGEPLPTDVVQRERRLNVADQTAYSRLNDLVRKAARELSALARDPVAIAASPNRFDDALNYEWRAVRCGTFFSESGSYMRRYDLERDILTAPDDAKLAYEILKRLEASGWRDLFATAFDIGWTDQSLAVVIQGGAAWLVFSSNNVSDDGDPVFAIWDDEPMSYFGEAKDRFDWAIQNVQPLALLSVRGEHIVP